MPNHVCMGALLQCSFGAAPSSMVVLPANKMLTTFVPAANIMDNKPMVNIMPFGVCTSMANPTVASATAAATAAALGVFTLTPMPCVPNTTAPWVPGAPTMMLANMPALDDSSTLMCMWGGVIKINFAGQVTEQIP
jgi:uncharacterized protein DUF4280